MQATADNYSSLMTLLKPQFDTLNNNFKDIKADINGTNKHLQEIHDKIIMTTDDVSHLKSRMDTAEDKIKVLEDITRKNEAGIDEYRKVRNMAIAVISSAIVLLGTILGWGINLYLENSYKQENIDSIKQMTDSYNKMTEAVDALKKQVETNK